MLLKEVDKKLVMVFMSAIGGGGVKMHFIKMYLFSVLGLRETEGIPPKRIAVGWFFLVSFFLVSM